MEVYEKLSDPIALVIFIITLFLPVLVGFITLKRTKDQTDFFIGGRTMNKFVVALSAVSSGRSSWLVLAVSGMAFTRGAGAVWAVVGYIIVEMFQFVYIGRKLRVETKELNSLTLLDYFESKFNDRKHLIRITGAIIIAIFITAYVSAQFNAGAKSLSTALNIPFFLSLIISGVLVLIYMILGGYIAVAYNDVIRAIIMILGLVVFPIYGLMKIGGLNILLNILAELNPAYIDPFYLSLGVIIGFLGIGLGSPGQPHILVRYMSINDPDSLRFSTIIGTFWNVVMAWGAVFIGLLGRALIGTLNSSLMTCKISFTNFFKAPFSEILENIEEIGSEMIYLVLSSEFFGPILYGLLIGGIFAAILSTADSQLLVVASTFIRDIYEKIYKKESLAESKKLVLSRYIVFFSGILAIILAYLAKDLIFWLVLFAWGGLGASFGTAVIFTLYWKKTTKIGIITGMITGTVVTILWKIFLKKVTGIYELIPAFICSMIGIFIMSLLQNKKSQKNQCKFDK